jgi:hypothetical protein
MAIDIRIHELGTPLFTNGAGFNGMPFLLVLNTAQLPFRHRFSQMVVPQNGWFRMENTLVNG